MNSNSPNHAAGAAGPNGANGANGPNGGRRPNGGQRVTSTVADPRFQARLRRRYARERRFPVDGADRARPRGRVPRAHPRHHRRQRVHRVAADVHRPRHPLRPRAARSGGKRERGHAPRRGLRRARQGGPPQGVSGGAQAPRAPAAPGPHQSRRVIPSSRHGPRGPVPRGRDPHGVGARGRRRGHAPQGAHRPQRPRGLAASQRSPDRNRGRADGAGDDREALQPRLLHRRGFA